MIVVLMGNDNSSNSVEGKELLLKLYGVAEENLAVFFKTEAGMFELSDFHIFIVTQELKLDQVEISCYNRMSLEWEKYVKRSRVFEAREEGD